MRKWRPTHKCIYVIPEVHGNFNSLEIILDRLIPLRTHINQEDVLVMLGDYIDGDSSGADVIDCLINIKQQYGDRAIFIKGNHEEMMLKAIYGSDNDFNYWIANGGISTILSYLKKANLQLTPHSIKRNRLADIIPKTHIDFLKDLNPYFIINEYVFFHGGFNPEKTISENNASNFPFDYTSSKYVKNNLKNNISPIFKEDYIYIGAHNYMSKVPFIHSKYFMLGGSAPKKMMIFELNSMSACAITNGKSRLYKYNFNIYE